ncbi:XkdQ/YqbQ family protein [Oribacterium sp. C9]|uniref:XkdQ/YqbQ family protein n=1 Tax=Oribacterium sp. C9 TaxID=1943579 RepID=UPI0011158C8F|nr:hydrolase [Oribacterium sp. C9]
MDIQLLISAADVADTGGTVYEPSIQDGLELTLSRKGSPGKLQFKAIGDSVLKIEEGNAVRLTVNGTPVFYGFVFKKKYDKNRIMTVTAYDQLRYLKNKNTYVYEGKTATQFIQMIADDFKLQVGTLEDTKYVIPSRVEENTTLFDMIGNALDLTLQNNKEMYVLYDDFGKLTLKSLESMRIGDAASGQFLMLDEETGENFDYESSIDDNTYNKVKLTYDNDQTGKRDVYITESSENINKWGVLQYFDTIKKGENGQVKAEALLQLYNQKTRKLKLTKQFGDCRVRGGSLVVVNLMLDDFQIKNFMLVEQVKHTFNHGEHWMDVTLRGGEFVG